MWPVFSLACPLLFSTVSVVFFVSGNSLQKVAMEMEGPSRLPRKWSGGFGLWVFGLWVVCVEGFGWNLNPARESEACLKCFNGIQF